MKFKVRPRSPDMAISNGATRPGNPKKRATRPTQGKWSGKADRSWAPLVKDDEKAFFLKLGICTDLLALPRYHAPLVNQTYAIGLRMQAGGSRSMRSITHRPGSGAVKLPHVLDFTRNRSDWRKSVNRSPAPANLRWTRSTLHTHRHHAQDEPSRSRLALISGKFFGPHGVFAWWGAAVGRKGGCC